MGRPARRAARGRSRQRFDLALVGDDPDAEADRLRDLGATWRGRGDDGTQTLADPDGNEFAVRVG